MEIRKIIPFEDQEAVYEEIERLRKLAHRSQEDRDRYEANRKIYRDNLATEQWALEMGEKKGRQIGLEEGIQIGREEGMLDAARGMKTKGYPLEDIGGYRPDHRTLDGGDTEIIIIGLALLFDVWRTHGPCVPTRGDRISKIWGKNFTAVYLKFHCSENLNAL